MNKKQVLAVLILTPTFAIIFLFVFNYFFIGPIDNQRYQKAWIDVNATNSCTGLTVLNSHLQNYLMTDNDTNNIVKQIQQKITDLKCP